MRFFFVTVRLAVVGILLLATSPVAAQEAPESEPPLQLPPVNVIGTTPIPTLGVPIEKYPGNAQQVTAEEIADQNLSDITQQLYRNIGAVNNIGAQNNPWQNDLTYRGFLAGPLTGTPIGLSVYLDGMRFNDGFGDTVNWDLIPQLAIASIDIIPGSNPLFGLNTLGGAIAVRTKRGFDFPGIEVGAYGGSFGRWAVEGEYGGFRGPFDWYVNFNVLNERGWRDQSPSDLRQVFAKVGYRTAQTDLELNYIWDNNDLVGNGLAPESLLARDYRAVYTFPDQTRNEMNLVNLRGSQWLTDALLLSGNAFYRNYVRNTFNGDAEVACVDDASDAEVFTASGQLLPLGLCQGSAVGFFDQGGNPLTGSIELEAEGEDRTTETHTQDWGVTLQLQHRSRIWGRANKATVAFAYDGHDSRFNQSQAPSDLVPVGNSVGTVRTGAFQTEVNVNTQQANFGAYFADTFDLTDRLALTLAGRYQHVGITIRDLTGENPDLNGNHSFDHFSPAVGFTWQALPNLLTAFFAYSEGFRAPTPAELTCADPEDPCNLPNAFLADPPLEPVIARTYEVGARGKVPVLDSLQWSLALFRTDLNDDIVFTVVETGGGGFFQNVARTRRQGLEVGLQGSWKRLQYSLSYAYVDATYQSNLTLASVTDPNGVQVQPGDHIPGIPAQNFKFGAELAILKNLWVGANVIHVSGSYLRGDEGNTQPTLNPYTILNLEARYLPIKQLELWARIDNVTNAKYATVGALNFNVFADPIAVQRFVAPGAPIAGWIGAKVRF